MKNDKDTILVIDYIFFFARNIKLIFLITISIIFLTLIYLLFFTLPVFVATATIFPSSHNPSSDFARAASKFGVNIPAEADMVDFSSSDLYPEIIKSRTLAYRLLSRRFYTERYDSSRTLLEILIGAEKNDEYDYETELKKTYYIIIGMIKIDENLSSGIFTIEVESFEPQLASDIAEAVIEEINIIQKKYKSQKVIEKLNFIKERIFDVGKELEDAEDQLKVFYEKNRKITNSPNLILRRDRMARNIEIIKGVYLTLKQQLELTKIEENQESALVQVLDPPESPLYKIRPQRRMIMYVSAFLGFIFSISFVGLMEYFTINNKEYLLQLKEAKIIAFKNITSKKIW